MKQVHRRRRLLVGRLQYRLLAITVSYFIIFAILVGVALFAPLIIDLESATLGPEQQAQAAVQFLYLHSHFWPALAVIFVVLAFHSILVSHRIAGPLFQFRRILKTVGDGDLTVTAHIRRHDYLHDEAQSVNEMIGGVATRLRGLQTRFGEAAAAWAGLRADLERGRAPEPSVIRAFAAKIVAIDAALGAFRIPKSVEGPESNREDRP